MTEWQTLFKFVFCGAALANACRLYIGFKRATAKLKSPIQKRAAQLRFACLPPGAEVSRRRFVFLQGDDEGAD